MYRNKTVSARDFRAKLAQYLSGSEPVLIGTDYNVRAVLVPARGVSSYDRQGSAKAVRDTVALLKNALESITN